MVVPPNAAATVPRVEVVGVPDAHARELLDVAMAVDPARQDQPARGIDLLRSARQVLGERDDAAAADADLGTEGVRGGHDRAVANDQIEVWHSAHHCGVSRPPP